MALAHQRQLRYACLSSFSRSIQLHHEHQLFFVVDQFSELIQLRLVVLAFGEVILLAVRREYLDAKRIMLLLEHFNFLVKSGGM